MKCDEECSYRLLIRVIQSNKLCDIMKKEEVSKNSQMWNHMVML